MGMKSIFRTLLYPLIFALVLFFAYTALSQQAHAMAGKALVVVRFNQPRVYYDQALYQAIAQAVEAKPGVMFDVISYAPETGNETENARWQEVAGAHTRTVVSSMNQMGVPSSRINVTGQRQAGLQYDETHVFVR